MKFTVSWLALSALALSTSASVAADGLPGASPAPALLHRDLGFGNAAAPVLVERNQPPTTCSGDGDCDDNQWCDNGEGGSQCCQPKRPHPQPCSKGSCCTSGKCGPDGKCMPPGPTPPSPKPPTPKPPSPKPPTCHGDHDCSSNEWCDNGSGGSQCCQPKKPHPEPCSKDSCCTSGKCGPDGKCMPPGPTPPSPKPPTPKPPSPKPPTCHGDHDCSSNEWCDNGSGGSQCCQPKKPHPEPCSKDSCCTSGKCGPDGKCMSPGPTPPGPSPPGPNPPGPNPPGPNPPGPKPPTCHSDHDCSSNEWCDNGHGGSQCCQPKKPHPQPCSKDSCCTSGKCGKDGKCMPPGPNPPGPHPHPPGPHPHPPSPTPPTCKGDHDCGSNEWCDNQPGGDHCCHKKHPHPQPCWKDSCCMSGKCDKNGKCLPPGPTSPVPPPHTSKTHSHHHHHSHTTAPGTHTTHHHHHHHHSHSTTPSPTPTPPPKCHHDSDCGSHEWCDNGHGGSNCCKPKHHPGHKCHRHECCESDICHQGKCQSPNRPHHHKKGNGSHCDNDDECKSTLCKSHKCEPQKPVGGECQRDQCCLSHNCDTKEHKCKKASSW